MEIADRGGEGPRAGDRRRRVELAPRRRSSLARHAKQAGADATLVVTPYYNKPTQEGMYLHFKAIADAVDLPMIIYNIPPRSVVDMSVDTMARLAKHKNIVGVKDATANLTRPLHTRRACGDDFCQLSGEDHTALSFNAAGGVGCISVTANVAPRLVAAMQDAWMEGRLGEAMAIQNRLVPLHDALFSRDQPGAGEVRARRCWARRPSTAVCRWRRSWRARGPGCARR